VTATLSADRRYRYVLERTWQPSLLGGREGHVHWCCFNPSVADEANDDPTLRRLIGFSERFGFSKLRLVNLFAFRATDPADLPSQLEVATGPENDRAIDAELAAGPGLVIAAWGAIRSPPAAPKSAAKDFAERAEAVLARLAREHEVFCLKTTKRGAPNHPVRLPYEIAPRWPTLFRARASASADGGVLPDLHDERPP